MFNTNFKREFQYQITLDSLEKDIGRLEIELKNNPKIWHFKLLIKSSYEHKAENAFVNKDYQTYWEKKIEQVGNIWRL